MKTKRAPKTFAEVISRKLNRKNQLESMKKAIAQKARTRQKKVEKSGAN